jgi:hypothetical protein
MGLAAEEGDELVGGAGRAGQPDRVGEQPGRVGGVMSRGAIGSSTELRGAQRRSRERVADG